MMAQANAIENRPQTSVAQPNNGSAAQNIGAVYTPALDVFEVEDAFIMEFDMPGAKADHIDVTCEGGLLEVSAEVEPRINENTAFLVQEYGVGRYERSVSLDAIHERIDPESIEASYTDGVLRLRLPKRAEATPRKIEVHGG